MKYNFNMKFSLNFLFIILSIFFQSLSGVFSKYAVITLQENTLISILSNVFFLLSLGCLFLQAAVWQQALIHYPISYAYPFMSLVNFVVLLLSAILFQEGITPGNITGLILISIGITTLSRNGGMIK